MDTEQWGGGLELEKICGRAFWMVPKQKSYLGTNFNSERWVILAHSFSPCKIDQS